MPKDFWGTGGSRREEEIKALELPKTLTMKLENRAFRANYLDTLRVRHLVFVKVPTFCNIVAGYFCFLSNVSF